MRNALLLLLLSGTFACRTATPEAMSLLGEPLYAQDVVPRDTSVQSPRAKMEKELENAFRVYNRVPNDEEAIIWYGRRLGYLARYREAQDVYSRGLGIHPKSYRLLRHRGHRWISLRQFQAAVDDLARATRLAGGVPDQVEKDGAPNPKGIPRSTTQGNIAYHLGLAHYLLGDYEASVTAYRRCLELARNDDSVVSAVYWLYLGLRRLGRDDEARAVLEPVQPEMDILENVEYHQLCVFYKGDQTADELIASLFKNETALHVLGGLTKKASDPSRAKRNTTRWATFGNGYATWLALEGRDEEATSLYRDVVDAKMWNAFGHIAAEAELAR